MGDGTRVQTLTVIAPDDVLTDIAYSPDGHWLAATVGYGRNHYALWVWSLPAGELLRSLPIGGPVLSWAPDSRTLAVPAADAEITLLRVPDLTPLRTFGAQRYGNTSLAYSPDGTLLASASGDQTAVLWRVADGQATATLAGHAYSTDTVRFAPDGRTVATVDRTGVARLWSVPDGKLRQTWPGTTGGSGLAFRPDGRVLAAGVDWDVVRLWRVAP